MKLSRRKISKQARSWTPVILSSAFAGLVASIPMGLAMKGLNRALPGRQVFPDPANHALPPKQITAEMAGRAGARQIMRPGPGWEPATWMAHAAYGAAAASLFPVVTRPLPLPVPLRGIAFALGVWAGSYLGWLPAAGILPPATQQSARRNVVMITSHVLWGVLTAVITRAILVSNRRASMQIE